MIIRTYLNWLCSFLIILLLLYFIPLLGTCLLVYKYFSCNSRKKMFISITLIIISLVILLPKGIHTFVDTFFHSSIKIPYFNKIINAELYNVHFVKYSHSLMTIGILFLFTSLFLKWIHDISLNFINSYISTHEKAETEIFQKNDLIMKQKREKARNTHVVYCPYCGADNLLESNIGICKYCRRRIEYKK